MATECSHAVLWPANHKMVQVKVDPNAKDDGGGPVKLTASVSCNEAANGAGDGNTSQDWGDVSVNETTGVVSLELRAERSGAGQGRIYTITVTATDEDGNASTATCAVTVPKSRK